MLSESAAIPPEVQHQVTGEIQGTSWQLDVCAHRCDDTCILIRVFRWHIMGSQVSTVSPGQNGDAQTDLNRPLVKCA